MKGSPKSLLNPTERIQLISWIMDKQQNWICIKLTPSSDTCKGPSGESKRENTCHSHNTAD